MEIPKSFWTDLGCGLLFLMVAAGIALIKLASK
jgi:hypothetical protein